jgi:hypothetical protein
MISNASSGACLLMFIGRENIAIWGDHDDLSHQALSLSWSGHYKIQECGVP